jgi:hypothetical protein
VGSTAASTSAVVITNRVRFIALLALLVFRRSGNARNNGRFPLRRRSAA